MFFLQDSYAAFRNYGTFRLLMLVEYEESDTEPQRVSMGWKVRKDGANTKWQISDRKVIDSKYESQ